MQTQKITLDFCQNDYKTVTVKQYDKDSRNLIITCTDNGTIYKLDSSTLQCNVKMNTPDDRAIYDTATINKDGTVLVTFSESMVYASGTGKLEIQFLDSSTGKTISTMILTVIIVGSVYSDDKIIASDEFNALTDALLRVESDVNDANEAIERINELEESVTTAEAGRVVAEESRVLAESKRVSAENTRIADENTRKTNETARQTAESKRQTDTATAIANAEEATDRANEIAENCKDLMLGSGISITTTEITLEGSKDGLIRIESVGGVCEQDSTAGNQLFDASAVSAGMGISTTSGNLYVDSTMFSTDYIDVSKFASIAWNGKSSQSSTWGAFYDANKSFIGAINKNGTSTFTIDIPSGASYVRLSFLNEYLNTAMVNGGTTVLPYEKYSGGIPSPNPSYPQEIKKTVISEIKTHGKNLFDGINKGNYLNNAVTNGGTTDADTGFTIKVDGGAYTVSSTATQERFRVACSNSIGITFACEKGVNKDGQSGSITIDCTGYAYLVVNATDLSAIMVNEGTVATAYEPYTESVIKLSQPIELYGIGDVQDVIEDGKVKRRFKRFRVPSSWNWQYSSGTSRFFVVVDIGITMGYQKDQPNAFCTHYTCAGKGSATDMIFTFINESSDGVAIRHKSFNGDINAFKAFLDANEVWCVWELKEETTEELPLADQIALNNLKSFDNITYLSTDSEVEPIITTEHGTSKTSAHAIEALNKIDNAEIEISEMKPIVDELKIPNITDATAFTMPNSYSGRLLIDEIGGGESEQFTTTGKNLLDHRKFGATKQNGVTCTPTYDNNGNLLYVNLDGTATSQCGFIVGYVDVKANVKYLLNGDAPGGSGSTHFYYVTNEILGSGERQILLTEDKILIVQVIVASGATVNNIKYYPMVRLASVTDATYEPFTNSASPNPSYPQEIKKSVVSEIKTRGKNLLDLTKASNTTTSDGITYTINSDGTVVANGTATKDTNLTLYRTVPMISGRYFNVIQLGGTYTGNIHHVAFDANWAGGKNNTLNVPSVLIDSYAYSRFRIGFSSGTVCNNLKVGFMVSTVDYDTFEPYTESVITLSQPIDLYGKNGVQDVIGAKDICRKWSKRRITSDRSFSYNDGWADGSFTIGGFFHDGVEVLDYTTVANMLCTHAKIATPSNIANGSAKNAVGYGGGKALYINFENCSTIDELKAFLNANEVYVYYRLETPTTAYLPIADQIALNSLSTYDGITYLEFDSEIEPTFKGEYGTSKVGGYTLEGMLAGRNGELYGKNYNDRLAALEAAIVNNI